MFAIVFFGDFNPRWIGLKDLQKTEIFGGAVLAASILFMGVYPKPFYDRITASVADLPGVTDPTTARSGQTAYPGPPRGMPVRSPLAQTVSESRDHISIVVHPPVREWAASGWSSRVG